MTGVEGTAPTSLRRFLIVRTDRIGDLILTLPMARVIKRFYPGAWVAVLIRHYTSELAAYDPYVDQVLYEDEGDRQISLFQLMSAISASRFDAVFHTHPRFRLALVTWLAGVPLRVGTGYRWYSFLFNRRVYEHRKDASRHELEYNLRLLEEIGCPFDGRGIEPRIDVQPFALEKARAILSNHSFPPNAKIVVLHPGSGGSARDWKPENFGALGRILKEDPGVAIVVTGGPGESELARRVASLCGDGAIVVAGPLTLQEYAALVGKASLFVANSTGPLHIAAAVGTPVIGFYPQQIPLSAARWGPYTRKKVIFSPHGKPVDCDDCSGGRSPCACMDSIMLKEVAAAARSMLSGSPLTGQPAEGEEAEHGRPE